MAVARYNHSGREAEKVWSAFISGLLDCMIIDSYSGHLQCFSQSKSSRILKSSQQFRGFLKPPTLRLTINRTTTLFNFVKASYPSEISNLKSQTQAAFPWPPLQRPSTLPNPANNKDTSAPC